MFGSVSKLVDRFVPVEVRNEPSRYPMYATFVLLHLLGPLLGQSVVLFIYTASDRIGWIFWTIWALICFFWLMPLLVRRTGDLIVPAMISVQTLVTLSLFGSFFYGGISSPFLPWLLIALLVGFFYLADRARFVLTGVAIQVAIFSAAHYFVGHFPALVPLKSLWLANLLSMISALIYVTLLALYYESVMRDSSALQEAAILHRRQAEELRAAMRQAERASHQKSIFLAKMSHELRTPLNAVIGYSEMLRDDLEDTPGAEEKVADLDRINAAGRHLNALVNEVLDLSRIESDDLQLENQEIDLHDLVGEAVATVEPLINVHGNRLVLQMSHDPGMIVADPLKLRQSLLNLLSNAAKFTSKGVITLTVMRRQTEKGDVIMIEVRDTGIGISRDGLKKLFRSFSQAEADTANRFGGTGLGLALTRRFCQAMGGSIDVESEIGVGTSFKIEIPAAPRRSSELAVA